MKNEQTYNSEYFLAEGYAFGYFPEFKYLADSLYDNFTPRTSLDIGCATGNLVKNFVELGVDAWGIDVSAYAILQSGLIQNRLKQIDITSQKLPFKELSFDLITMTEVIEHIGNDTHILNEIYRLLSIDGICYITTPTPKAPPQIHHINIHDKNYWVNLFEKHEFNVTCVKPLYGYTLEMAINRSKEWSKLPKEYKEKNRPKILINLIEAIPIYLRILIFFINGFYKQFKNNSYTYRFILRKKI